MIGNENFFNDPLYRDTYLEARGFGKDGTRTGGIVDPRKVVIPTGAVLGRFFQSQKGRYGQWWWTMAEMATIVAYFGRYGTDPDAGGFGTGRKEGKGIVQGTLAVRADWREDLPDKSGKTDISEHMEHFCFGRTTCEIMAFYGDGDVAPSADQRSVLKPVQIADASGTRRGARQLFLPKLWTYDTAISIIEDGSSDSDLLAALARQSNGALYFET